MHPDRVQERRARAAEEADVIGPDEVVYGSGSLKIGRFRASPRAPWFEDSGPAQNHILVFPRTAVSIAHAGGEPVIADPTRVMLYNRGQEYRRTKISDEGDRCEWFAVPREAIVEAARPFDSAAGDRPERPFAFTHAPGDPSSYLLQRRVLVHVTSGAPDPLFVEEAVLSLVRRIVARAYAARGAGRGSGAIASPRTSRAHADLAEAAAITLAGRFCEALSTSDVARAVGASPFHLCRVFRSHTGLGLHAYRNRLRLAHALERIAGGEGDLTALALDLGYSSHSHFTSAFRAVFGVPPSQALRASAPPLARITPGLSARAQPRARSR